MHETRKLAAHAEPFICHDTNTKSLHFSLCELQSRMRVDRPDVLDVEYTKTMAGFLLFNRSPASIVMIGLGGGSLAKFCHRHLPESNITVVEINPHVIALRDEFQVPANSPRFRVVEADGVHFVKRSAAPCDVLLVDGYDDSGMPSGLGTQLFYDNCYQMLSADGLMVVNLHTGHPDFSLFICRIERSFGAHVLTVNVKREGNSVVFASKVPLAEQQHRGVLGEPQMLPRDVWAQFKPTFAQVAASLQEA